MSELASSCSGTSPWPLELCTEPKKSSMRTELDKNVNAYAKTPTYTKALHIVSTYPIYAQTSTKIHDQITPDGKLTGTI